MIRKILGFLKNLIIPIIAAIAILMFVINLNMIICIKRQLALIYAGIDATNTYLLQIEKRIEIETIKGIKRDIELLTLIRNLKESFIGRDDILSQTIKRLQEKLEQQITKSEQIENKLKQAIVMIVNITQGFQGSGVIIKNNGNYYVLSVNHLIEKTNDEIYVSENDEPTGKLKLIKKDKTRDLACFKFENENYIPESYVELNEKELEKGTPIYVIGNPLGIEDVLSEGRILKNKGFVTYFIDHSYYGSSGGGIFTKEGKLLGIIQTIGYIRLSKLDPGFAVNGAGRLSQIKDFLGDIN